MISKKRFWGIVSMICALLIGLMTVKIVYAANTPDNIGFSVSAQIPSNQINQGHSFFDLRMSAGQHQQLKTVIYNTTKRDLKVKVGIHTAYTNNNGIIEYVTATKKFDKSLKYQLGKLTKIIGPTTVIVPANGSKTVEAEVHMPDRGFNGVMLGGWYFERIDEKVTSEVTDSMNVHNQYAYVIGMKYTMGKIPKARLLLDSVKPGLENGHQSISSYLRNVSAVIIPDVTLDTTITNRKNEKVVKNIKKSNVQLAPNSLFKYPVMLNDPGMKSGNYHLKMVAKSKSNRWVFEKDFTITVAEAKKYSRTSVDNQSFKVFLWVLVGAIGMLVLGLVVLGIVYSVKRRIGKQ